MKPIKLTLTGFAGISSSRSKETLTLDLASVVPAQAQLVALAGPNGSGKTTIIDNLHPYRVMPSHANGGSPGSFSYYDHMGAGEAAKELIWEHAGVRYLSTLRMRATAKTKRMEAYLFVVQPDGSTQPWTDPATGLTSDGKAENYDQCLERVLGKPEVFFAAQFSAQGKTPISKMSASEIKKLLAQMLRMDEVAALSGKANEVYKALKPHLVAEQELSMRIRGSLSSRDVLLSSLQRAQDEERVLEAELANWSAEITRLIAEQATVAAALEKQVSIRAQHETIDEQIAAAQAEARRQSSSLAERQAQEVLAIERAKLDAQEAVQMAQTMMQQLRHRQEGLEALLARVDDIDRATKRSEELREQQRKLRMFIEDKAPDIKQVATITQEVQQLTESLTKLASDGEHLKAALLLSQRTAALLDEVPCKGSDLAGQCKLLCQANEAAQELPQQQAQLANARSVYRLKLENKSVSLRVLEALQETSVKVAQAQADLAKLDQELASCREVLALRDQVERAKAEIASVRADLTSASEQLQRSRTRHGELQGQVEALHGRHQQEKDSQEELNQKAMSNLMQLKRGLPALVDEAAQGQVQRQLIQAQESKAECSRKLAEKERQINALKVELDVCDKRLEEAQAHDRRAREISQEMAMWMLLSKALGSDGVIAMSIDDAGPAISSLANALLEDCYGGRFVISIQTQEQTAAGLQRETFNVMVEDTLRGETKLLELMSGGEKVWINECLVRALSLYMARTSDIHFQTLFSDESDGPLDPERKRQYMAMKRTVLEKGGYEREFLITQTPELLHMCDAVIDVTIL